MVYLSVQALKAASEFNKIFVSCLIVTNEYLFDIL